MRTNSIILAALIAVIAMAVLANRASTAREFDALRLERHTTLELLTARVNKLPELRERTAQLERRLMSYIGGCANALSFQRLHQAVPARDAKPVMPITLAAYGEDSFTIAELEELLRLESAIREAHSRLPLVYETECRLARLEEMIETYERSPKEFLLLGGESVHPWPKKSDLPKAQ